MKTQLRVLQKLMTAGFVAGFLISIAACDTKSNVEFLGKRSELKANLARHTALSTGQGGVIQGQTTSGYKVNVTLGTSNNVVRGVTASGHQVEMNFQGQSPVDQ